MHHDTVTTADFPVSFTEAACAHIRLFLDPTQPTAGFRIAIKPSGCSGFSYVADVVPAPERDDLCGYQGGLPVYLAKESLSALQGTCVDLIEKAWGQKQLVFHNPNAENHCGCGESFTLKPPSSHDTP